MALVLIEGIVSRQEFGLILAARVDDGPHAGASVRLKATHDVLLGEPGIGETWTIEGTLKRSEWGPQVDVTRGVRALPSGRMMIDFLATSVSGIGQTRAARLWDRYEDRLPETLEIGDVAAIAAVMEPDRPSLGPRLAAAAIAAWKSLAGQSRLVEWLAAAGLTDFKLARRIQALLGDDAPARLQTNPWCLVPLAPWGTVDALGVRLSKEAGATEPRLIPNRLVGAADAVIKDVIGEGSTAVEVNDFRDRLASKLGVSATDDAIRKAQGLAVAHRAVTGGPAGLLRAPGCALMEDAVVARLRLMSSEGPPDRLRAPLDALRSDPGTLHPEQRDAVLKVLSAGFACLRGGAGTGKTHVARTICQIWESDGGDLLLTAVAGKAALRLSRSTGRLARTLFRTLRELDERADLQAKLDDGSLESEDVEKTKKRLTDLAAAGPNTLVVIDEASMLDLASCHGLLRRLPAGARVLMIGDECQLPPVAFGLLFHKFVEDEDVTANLITIHRQASDSGIPAAAALVRRREMPDLQPYAGPADGVSFVHASGREAIADATAKLYGKLGGRDGDILVVTPVNEGPCGTAGLNRRLHDAHIETSGLQELRGSLGEIFSAGEPVLHRRNDYARGLFNGSMGKILRIDRSARSLVATFDGEEHIFENGDLIDLSLGYALTCHRGQGSEADRVIVALPDSRLLDPAWIYTAITRAKRQVILVGEVKTLAEALRRPWAADRRLVGLAWSSSR
jgi:exodeoxyribonuclease V alpha subunit